MKISRMNENTQQCFLKWCKQHDWGCEAKLIGGQITDIQSFEVDPKNRIAYVPVTASFDNTDDLREWAGYWHK
ncbi:hypothetical protein [Agaribacterium sp. ZY112]|uniref:hypothetical protein n=1 Tax=Agaribacterium sp. ZY112 TaxID=3233574 RepID=UPI003525C0B1